MQSLRTRDRREIAEDIEIEQDADRDRNTYTQIHRVVEDASSDTMSLYRNVKKKTHDL